MVRSVVVAPTYNNALTVLEVLRGIEAQGLPIIVVNDGSTDGTAERLAEWAEAERSVPVRVLTHHRNCGKGTALRSGFDQAAADRYTHAATIDTDRQHRPEDLPKLLGRAEADPRALILGVREADEGGGRPTRNRFGRYWSDLAVRWATGLRLTDSQCGLRVYPLSLLREIVCRSGHYALETEILIRAAWAGWPIEPVTLPDRYLPPQERVSHFRPCIDSLRWLGLYGSLCAERLSQAGPLPNRDRRRTRS